MRSGIQRWVGLGGERVRSPWGEFLLLALLTVAAVALVEVVPA
ncbi:MAG: hypothetical protein ABEJ70_08195 [Halobacteriaceae archaeon]